MKIALIASLLCNVVLAVFAIGFASRTEADVAEFETESDEFETDEGSLPFEEHVVPVPPMVSSQEADEDFIHVLVEAGWSEANAGIFELGKELQARLIQTLDLSAERNYWETPAESGAGIMILSDRLRDVIEDEIGLRLIEHLDVETYPMEAERVRQVARIYHDYEVMSRHFATEGVGVPLPEDRPYWELMRQEMLQDMHAVFSPEESVEFEMRFLDSSEHLRSKMLNVEPTEGDFREIFRLHHGINSAVSSDDPEERRQQYEQARESAEKQMQEVLGEQRYRQFVREGQHTYMQISAIAERLSLPLENANEAFDLRENAERLWNELQSLEGSVGERRELQTKLSRETREELTELLGETGFELFQHRAGLHWLE